MSEDQALCGAEEKAGSNSVLTIRMHPSFHLPLTLTFTPLEERTRVKCKGIRESWDLLLPKTSLSERVEAFRRVKAAGRPQVLVLDGMRVTVRWRDHKELLKLEGANVGGDPVLVEFIASTLRLLLAADAPDDLREVLYGVGIYVGVKPS